MAPPLIIGLLLLLALPAWAGQGLTRHSGTVVSMSRDAGTLAVDEVGPWRLSSGETGTTRRTFAVTAATRFVRVARVPALERAPSGWLGDYLEAPLEPWAVTAGEFVTVEAVRERGRLTAVTVAAVAAEP